MSGLTETDIRHCARVLVKETGSAAAEHAQRRAAALLLQGDRAGWAVWRRIRAEIERQDREDKKLRTLGF